MVLSFLQAGRSYSLDELLHGVIVQSGNDAAVVIAEGISELKISWLR